MIFGLICNQGDLLFLFLFLPIQIFRLEPKVRGLSLHENEEPQTETQELTVEEKTQKTRELDLKYSTKKSIQLVYLHFFNVLFLCL